MRNFLSEMLYALTSAYTRKDYENVTRGDPPETNIGKLFAVFSWGLDTVKEQAELIRLWDNLDNASGSVLDRYGANFGVKRLGTTDEFYRLAIRVKVMAQLSGGDNDTVINAAAELFSVTAADIELEDDFPAKIKMFVNASVIPENRRRLIDQIGAAIKRILAAGVGFSMYLVYVFRHVIEVSSIIELWSYSMPPCNTLYCGTFPYRATLGWTTKAIVRAAVKLFMPIYTPRFAGTYPYRSTLGWLIENNLCVDGTVVYAYGDRYFCGIEYCGTVPLKAIVGWTGGTAVNASAAFDIIKYLVRLCGTYPDTATLGNVISVLTAAGYTIDVITNDGRQCGTEPDRASLGNTVRITADTSGKITLHTGESIPAGTEKCGTSPLSPHIVKYISSDILSAADLANVLSAPPLSGLQKTGNYPYSTGIALITGGGAEISSHTAGLKNIPQRSGMNDCGTTPERIAAGGITKAPVHTQAAVSITPAEVPYTAADCGTYPVSHSAGEQTMTETQTACYAEGYNISSPPCNTKYCGQNK